ncbi:hypothetical protein [Pseudorhodoplanes sp.]|uniref:hypothetical protein n=1 Tax=Pseudorhodoplanes sp. TaxID=1934341 RepID=UPI00391A046F
MGKRVIGAIALPRNLKEAEVEAARAAHDAGGQFRNFYVKSVLRSVSDGQPHSTIGGHLKNGPFEAAGVDEFKFLLELGLTRNSVCIDYGCGTLRIGQHVMQFVAPGNYWGLDIDEELLKLGEGLVGNALISERRPNLLCISDTSIANAAKANPDFVFSWKVLQHVHPDELHDHLRAFCLLIGRNTNAFICRTKWHESRTLRYKLKGWAHSLTTVRSITDDLGIQVEVVTCRHKYLSDEGSDGAKAGTLRLKRSTPRIS